MIVGNKLFAQFYFNSKENRYAVSINGECVHVWHAGEKFEVNENNEWKEVIILADTNLRSKSNPESIWYIDGIDIRDLIGSTVRIASRYCNYRADSFQKFAVGDV